MQALQALEHSEREDWLDQEIASLRELAGGDGQTEASTNGAVARSSPWRLGRRAMREGTRVRRPPGARFVSRRSADVLHPRNAFRGRSSGLVFYCLTLAAAAVIGWLIAHA